MIFAILPNEQIKTDISLLERISRRDSSALSELYDKHSTLLYSIIMRILKEKEETEDVLQEVFVNVWERAEMYDGQLGNPGAWLARIARNRAVDRLRSKNYRTRSKESDIDQHHDYFTADASSNPEHRAILSSQQEEILIALTSLSKDQKDLIEFAYFRGFTQSELADHFKLPLGTVKTRMRTAMSILRQKLRHHLA
ncbi:MAG: sigma-70 family RNA polymerase sigma factor [Ignavibacteriales bacterium]|nr:sigma-70 family RNA polymerase sigma factor [Ignavibacteriales bacterium]